MGKVVRLVGALSATPALALTSGSSNTLNSLAIAADYLFLKDSISRLGRLGKKMRLTLRFVVLLSVGFGLIVGVCEANNPMPMPNLYPEDAYRYGDDTGILSGFSFEGLLWGGGLVALFLFFAFKK